MIESSWQKDWLEAHIRYIEPAKRQVAEAEAQLDILTREIADGRAPERALATAEKILKTSQAILYEMESHAEYIRNQFAYLNELESQSKRWRPILKSEWPNSASTPTFDSAIDLCAMQK